MSSHSDDAGRQPATAAAPFATYDQLVEALHDIEWLTGGDDPFYTDEVLANRKFLVEPADLWELRQTFSFRAPAFNYDGEVLTFKMQTDTFHNVLSAKLSCAVFKEVYTAEKNSKLLSKYLADNNLAPTITQWPVTAKDEVRSEDFGVALVDYYACVAGEVC